MMLARDLSDTPVSLRPLEWSLVTEAYLDWMRDPEISRFLESRFSTHSAESLERFISDCNASRSYLLAGIFLSGRHVGNIKLHVDWNHKRGDLGILIGDKSVWGQGIARKAISLLADYAFADLGVEKLCAGCYEHNIGSIRAFKCCGFEIESVRRKHFMDGHRRVDGIYLARFAPALGAPQ